MKKVSTSASPQSIDAYLSALPPKIRTVLDKLRQTIRSVAPRAEEVISYQIPVFKYHYMLVGFAAFKDHCSFFVMSTEVMKLFKQELTAYSTATATIHFRADTPLPVGLIKKLVRARMVENETRLNTSQSKKHKTPKSASAKAPAASFKVSLTTSSLTADQFIKKLYGLRSTEHLKSIQRFFKSGEGEYGEGDKFIGVKMGQLFTLAKEFIDMPITEIEKLLESPIHEVRAGAVSIMDKQARSKKTPESRRKELFDLYMRRHDRINNWDLVDLGCLHMTGSYLFNKPRTILYKLARSKNIWERRTAIVSTAYFIRQGDVADTFKIAQMLVNDAHDLVHKGTGWMLRFAGDRDRPQLLRFLDKYSATMPRTLLRYAIEKLDAKQKKYYMNMKLTKAGKQ